MYSLKIVSFIEYIKTGVETRFETSSYQLDRLLPKGKNEKVITLMKDELGGKIITKIVRLRPKNL